MYRRQWGGFMEAQEVKESRRELQTVLDAVSQQNAVLQRLERNLRRLEDAQARLASRVDAVEAARASAPAEPPAAPERTRSTTIPFRPANPSKETPVAEPDPPPEPKDEAPAAAPQLTFVTRAKSVLRGAILDGTVGNTLDKVQSTLKLADEAAGALAQISAMVKASLELGEGTRGAGAAPIPGGSWPLLLELAKTPQFQKFIANILVQFLREMDKGETKSSEGSAS